MNTPLQSKEGTSKKTLRHTPYNNNRRSSSGCFAPFKSPCSSSKNSSKVSSKRTTDGTSKVDLAQEVLALQKQVEEKDKEIEELDEDYNEEELQQNIEKLHEYNEIKDVAQMLIGKLAEMEGTTTKKLYSTFNLDFED